jgi:hypothetical protein
MKTLLAIKSILEFLGGALDQIPREAGVPRWVMVGLMSPVVRGLWWGLLVGMILLFCGQTSKFIYIDF